jgi:hypothetical protein
LAQGIKPCRWLAAPSAIFVAFTERSDDILLGPAVAKDLVHPTLGASIRFPPEDVEISPSHYPFGLSPGDLDGRLAIGASPLQVRPNAVNLRKFPLSTASPRRKPGSRKPEKSGFRLSPE